jgi:peptidoglycan/xylan/chitin deacetylase (PgdA/CDA1 family)
MPLVAAAAALVAALGVTVSIAGHDERQPGGIAAAGSGTPPARSPAQSPTATPTGDRQVQPAPADGARDAGARVVYLSFDDGPDPRYTPQVLDLLDRHQVKATFFQLGGSIARHPDLTRRAHEAGHSIQNHSWSHPDLRGLSTDRVRTEVTSTDEKIREHTGYTPRCLRPPYGATNARVKSVAAALGKKVRLWTIDTEDWRNPDAGRIARHVLANVQPGSIVLMHDGGGDRSETVAALPTIIDALKERGYAFAPLWCR